MKSDAVMEALGMIAIIISKIMLAVGKIALALMVAFAQTLIEVCSQSSNTSSNRREEKSPITRHAEGIWGKDKEQ